MIFSLMLFLLSSVETETFTPFPSGWSTYEQNQVTYIAVDQSEGFFSLAPGAPYLPMVSRVFILPGRCEINTVSVSFNEPDSEENLIFPLAGAPVVRPVGQTTPTEILSTTQNLILGNNSVTFRTGHILDAYTIVSCSVNPWKYDSESQQLALASSCTINLNWVTVNEQSNLSSRQIEMINFRASALAENYDISYEQIPYLPGIDAAVDYLVITDEKFLSEMSILQNLLDFKNLSYEVVTVQSINGNWEGRDTQEDIRNCIKYYAQNEGTTFVLLAGDETVVPVRDVYTECEGFIEFAPTDLYYSDLDGSWDENENGIFGEWDDNPDLYADVLLGRLLFSTSESAVAIFEKNTAYTNVEDTQNWYRNVVLCAANLFPDIGYTGNRGCELMALEFPSTFNFTKSYELAIGDYPDTYFPVIYEGAGWNHYSGHGNDRGVYWADFKGILSVFRMSGFVNEGQYGIHSSIGCHVGDYTDPGICLADTLLTMTGGGGVAGLFNTSWGWEGYWPQIGSSERLCNYTVEQVYQNKASSLGLAYTSAKDLEIPHMTGPYDRVLQSIIAYSAFMDPSLEVLGVSSFNPIPPPPFQVVMLSNNPHTINELQFKVTGVSSAYDVTVFNLAGRAVLEPVSLNQNTKRTVEIGFLPTGIYFVSAKAPGGATASESFVILR